MNIFRIEYDWCEGEHQETLLAKNVKIEDFEKDIIKAKKFAESLIGKEGKWLGKGYSVDCLPQYYSQILWFLTEKLGYIICDYYPNTHYNVDDSANKKITITRMKQKMEIKELK